MVHVNNLIESGERQTFTRQDCPSQALQDQVQGIMRDTPLQRGTGRASETATIDLSPPIYGSNCDGTARAHKQPSAAEKNFVPDMTYSTPKSREFQQKMHEQRDKPIMVDGAGKYEVKPGDTLSTIVERCLKIDGGKPTQAEIQKGVKELEQLNGDQLGNRHLLRPGMKLKLSSGPEDMECKANGAAQGSYPADAQVTTSPDAAERNFGNLDSADKGFEMKIRPSNTDALNGF